MPVAGVHLYGHTCHSACFTRVAHMCHDMTGPAIMAGRLGARTFYLPLAGIACHGHYTCDLDSYVGLIGAEVMLCFLKMNRLGCGLVNNCLVGCLFCLTCCLFADFCVCLYPSSEVSLQLRLWMAFRLTLVVSFVACPCRCNEQLSHPKKKNKKKTKKRVMLGSFPRNQLEQTPEICLMLSLHFVQSL